MEIEKKEREENERVEAIKREEALVIVKENVLEWIKQGVEGRVEALDLIAISKDNQIGLQYVVKLIKEINEA